MPPTSESDRAAFDSGQGLHLCLERTRSHVLNVLVVVGLSIAVSGWLLRGRAQDWQPWPAKILSDSLYVALIALAAASYIARRISEQRATRAEADRRDHLFYWSHVAPALIAAAAIPLGFAYGWLVAPRLDAVIPFWAVPFALGFLSLPRKSELTDLERPASDGGPSRHDRHPDQHPVDLRRDCRDLADPAPRHRNRASPSARPLGRFAPLRPTGARRSSRRSFRPRMKS